MTHDDARTLKRMLQGFNPAWKFWVTDRGDPGWTVDIIDQLSRYVPLSFTLDRNGNVETWKYGVPW